MTPTNKNFDSKNPKRKRQSGKRSAKTKTTPSVEREEHEKAAEIVRQLARRHNRKKKSRLNATRHLGDYEVDEQSNRESDEDVMEECFNPSTKRFTHPARYRRIIDRYIDYHYTRLTQPQPPVGKLVKTNWICALCHRTSCHGQLGDLFGPYYITLSSNDDLRPLSLPIFMRSATPSPPQPTSASSIVAKIMNGPLALSVPKDVKINEPGFSYPPHSSSLSTYVITSAPATVGSNSFLRKNQNYEQKNLTARINNSNDPNWKNKLLMTNQQQQHTKQQFKLTFKHDDNNKPHQSQMQSPEKKTGKFSYCSPSTSSIISASSTNLLNTNIRKSAPSTTTELMISPLSASTADIWFHGKCALWAPELHLVGGRLSALRENLRNYWTQMCCVCSRMGATIPIQNNKLLSNKDKTLSIKSFLHYPCAIERGYLLDELTFVCKQKPSQLTRKS